MGKTCAILSRCYQKQILNPPPPRDYNKNVHRISVRRDLVECVSQWFSTGDKAFMKVSENETLPVPD